MSEIKRKRGRPEGSAGPTRRFNRGLAAYAREHMTPELYVEWKLAIAQGHDAQLVKDERCTSTGGFRVEHREGGPVPSLEYRDRAITDLRQAAYGLPAQQQQVDVQIKQQQMIGIVGIDARASRELDVGSRSELLATIERLLGDGRSAPIEHNDVDDAEFQDVNVKEPEGESEPD